MLSVRGRIAQAGGDHADDAVDPELRQGLRWIWRTSRMTAGKYTSVTEHISSHNLARGRKTASQQWKLES